MESSSSARPRGVKVLAVILVTGVLSGLFWSATASTQPKPPTPANRAAQAAARRPDLRSGTVTRVEMQKREAWSKAMSQLTPPTRGCFEAAYPARQWKQTACAATPTYPQPPRRGAPPLVVGNSNDIAPQAPSGFISTATGSFDTVSGVTSESGPIGNSGPSIANAYTLQLNTDFFSSTACSGSPNPSCLGWQQFVFENNGSTGRGYIQYWLIRYNTTCPPGVGWNQFSFTGSTDIYCWKNNSLGAVSVPNQPIANLAQLSLTGAVSATGDRVTVTAGGTAHTVAGDNAVAASGGWRTAEFNIFGDGGNSSGGGQASFNSGATVVPRTRVIYGGTAPPTCTAQGFTAETNNLSFGPTPPAATAPGPALLFTESIAGGSTSNCAAATAVGDTHLKTFAGLMYDFQATGDFLLAETGADFIVQTRQVSGAPTWPNASVNKAVAVQTGGKRVAICLAPTRVEIDGAAVQLADGKPVELADGAGVLRTGNTYLVRGASGDSMRAVVNNDTYIDVSVGLGRWPSKARGLLANGSKGVTSVATREGAVLMTPLAFETLYGRYGESWRVPARQSMLSACGEARSGVPKAAFFAANLDPQLANRTRAVCARAGVRKGPLMDACTLDVAVLGTPEAAKVFVGAANPVAVGDPRPHGRPTGGGEGYGQTRPPKR